MRSDISNAAKIVCPMCDEKKCVGRYNCKQISDYLKTKLVDIGQTKKTHTTYTWKFLSNWDRKYTRSPGLQFGNGRLLVSGLVSMKNAVMCISTGSSTGTEWKVVQ